MQKLCEFIPHTSIAETFANLRKRVNSRTRRADSCFAAFPQCADSG
jgi:hypothetical protein